MLQPAQGTDRLSSLRTQDNRIGFTIQFLQRTHVTHHTRQFGQLICTQIEYLQFTECIEEAGGNIGQTGITQ
ncbi:hypothetical protein D3C81_2004500 [compost metagenome]